MAGAKDKTISLFSTNTTKDYGASRVKNMHGGVMKQRKLKTQKHSEDKINKNTRNIFRIKKENEAIKDRIIRDTRVGKL